MFFDQSAYEIRCEWGEAGIEAIASARDVVIIVDVLSFSTCVDIAVSRGATVYPYAGPNPAEYAARHGALLASTRRGQPGFSLSPASLLEISAGSRLCLPSPNGSALTITARKIAPHAAIMAGCLRNARAVSVAATRLGRRIAVIPAGERWPGGCALRPAIEDLIGAGAIIARLQGSRSPEADVAVAAFERASTDLAGFLRRCASGRELVEQGFTADVDLSAQIDASHYASRLTGDAYAGELIP